ncbi:MAG: EamA family transporter [Candidatus Ozemobacteraceae bacterium]
MNPRIAFWLLILMNLIWGGSYAISKWTLMFIPPATLALIRFALGGTVLLLFTNRKAATFSRRDWFDLALIGGLGISIAFILHLWGIKLTSATKVSIEITLEPVFMILLAILFLRESPQPRMIGALCISITGTLLLVTDGKSFPQLWTEMTSGGELYGDLLVILSVILGGVYTVLSKPPARRLGAMAATAWGSLLGALFLIPVSAWEVWTGPAIIWSWGMVLAVGYLGLICTALGYTVWNLVLIDMPVSEMAITLNVQPLAGMIIGMYWLGERLSGIGWIGATTILIGVYLTPATPFDESRKSNGKEGRKKNGENEENEEKNGRCERDERAGKGEKITNVLDALPSSQEII